MVGSFGDYVGLCSGGIHGRRTLHILGNTRELLEERDHLALNIIQNWATNYKMEISQEK